MSSERTFRVYGDGFGAQYIQRGYEIAKLGRKIRKQREAIRKLMAEKESLEAVVAYRKEDAGAVYVVSKSGVLHRFATLDLGHSDAPFVMASSMNNGEGKTLGVSLAMVCDPAAPLDDAEEKQAEAFVRLIAAAKTVVVEFYSECSEFRELEEALNALGDLPAAQEVT